MSELSDALEAIRVAVQTAMDKLSVLLDAMDETPSDPADPLTLKKSVVTDSTILVTWSGGDSKATWVVGRDGEDASGYGDWKTKELPNTTREWQFNSLKPGTEYTITLTSSGLEKQTLKVTTSGAQTTPTDPVPTDPGDDHGPVAKANGWTEAWRDDFNGDSVDLTKWSVYNSPGHNKNGLRRPSAFTIVADPTALGGKTLRCSGDKNGTTGGMASKYNTKYGRWGARMRVPKGDSHYHPVLLTWPEKEGWPDNGEIDFAEGNCSSNKMQFFLHYGNGTKNGAQTSADITLDVTQWHWYEVEWTSSGVRGWVDGKLFFEDKNTGHSSYNSAHHATVQLDWFPDGAKTTGTGEMYVDAYRAYKV